MTKYATYHSQIFFQINRIVLSNGQFSAKVQKICKFFEWLNSEYNCRKLNFFKLSPNLWKNAKSFLEKMEFYPEDPRYALQTFPRQSSDYLRHSVLSPKRFGQKEMKIDQKARPPPKNRRFWGGSRGY